jgi:hypothetical protein
MKTTLLVTVAAAAALFSGCTKQDRTNASTTVQDAYSDTKAAVKDAYGDTKAAINNAWDNARSYSYDKKNDFTTHAKAMSSEMDANIQKLRTEYSEAKASASRKAAMEELKNSESDYKQKLDALGNASAATWDSAKQNVISAWDRMQAAYHKARAD